MALNYLTMRDQICGKYQDAMTSLALAQEALSCHLGSNGNLPQCSNLRGSVNTLANLNQNYLACPVQSVASTMVEPVSGYRLLYHQDWMMLNPPFPAGSPVRYVQSGVQSLRQALNIITSSTPPVSGSLFFGLTGGNLIRVMDINKFKAMTWPVTLGMSTKDANGFSIGSGLEVSLYEVPYATQVLMQGTPLVASSSTTSGLNHLGLFKDNPARAPFGAQPVSPFKNVKSVAECMAYAKLHGKTVFGVEAGSACFLAPDIVTAQSLGPELQKTAGSFDADKRPMGGDWCFNLYTIAAAGV